MSAIRDLIIPGSLRIVVTEYAYVTARCGRCAAEFEARAGCKTTRCKRCGRVCRLDHPGELPANVTPLHQPWWDAAG